MKLGNGLTLYKVCAHNMTASYSVGIYPAASPKEAEELAAADARRSVPDWTAFSYIPPTLATQKELSGGAAEQ